MSVIDSEIRLGLGSGTRKYFAVCEVRGNSTAISIETPIEAGSLDLRRFSRSELNGVFAKYEINERMIRGGWEIIEKKNEAWSSSGRYFLEIETDQFVSDQMASQLFTG